MINIILAESQNIVRYGIKTLLNVENTFNIVGEAHNGADVLAMLEQGIEADIILADIEMPLMDGCEMAQRIVAQFAKSRVIMLTSLSDDFNIAKAFNYGAMGYLLKNTTSEELIFAIRHVTMGKRYVCSEIATKLLERFLTVPLKSTATNLSGVEFSRREIEIIRYIADGYTNQEIADTLFISKRTVEGHRQTIAEKTGIRTAGALIKYAIINGIIS